MSNIKVGDLVMWKSQASGSRVLKVGVVVGITEAGEKPSESQLDLSIVGVGLERHKPHFGWNTQPRDTRSYFVSVKTGASDSAKRTLYRPREVTLAKPDLEDGLYYWSFIRSAWVR